MSVICFRKYGLRGLFPFSFSDADADSDDGSPLLTEYWHNKLFRKGETDDDDDDCGNVLISFRILA